MPPPLLPTTEEEVKMMGHNALNDAAARATAGLAKVNAGEDQTMEGWLEYGQALLDGKRLTEDPNCGVPGANPNERFGNWKGLSQLATNSRDDEAAAIWAAGNPTELDAMRKANPKVKTLRGLHQKHKNAQNPKPKPKPEPKGENTTLVLDLVRAAGTTGLTRNEIAAGLKNGLKHVDQSIAPLLRDGRIVYVEDRYYDPDLAPGWNEVPDDAPKSVKEWKAKLERRFAKEFDWRVAQEVRAKIQNATSKRLDDLSSEFKRMNKRLDLLTKGQRIKIDRDDYKALKMVVYQPHNCSEDVQRRALEAFKSLDVEPLTKEELEAKARVPTFEELFGHKA